LAPFNFAPIAPAHRYLYTALIFALYTNTLIYLFTCTCWR